MVSPPDCPNAPGTAFIMANRWLPMHTGNEPNCNESSLDLPAIKVRPRVKEWRQGPCNELDGGRGRASSRPLSGEAGAGLRAVHAERSRNLARHAHARRRAAGRRQQPHFRRHQISHAVHLVACRALCRADRRPRDRRGRVAGAGGSQYRPGRGGGAAVEICPLPHPHLPADRADRGRLRARLRLRGRAHRLRLRSQEHHRPHALSVSAAGAAALAPAHDGARLRPSNPHHLLGADRASFRECALSDPAQGDAARQRGGAPRNPGNPPFHAVRPARFRHLALFRGGQADPGERLRLQGDGLGRSSGRRRRRDGVAGAGRERNIRDRHAVAGGLIDLVLRLWALPQAAAGATLAWVLSIMASLGIITGALFLMPAVTAFVGSFFVDEVAEAVEREHYPAEPPGHALPLLRALIEGVQFTLLALVVYLCALPFIFLAGLGVIILFLANSYLLGREYFELAAMR